MRLRQLGCAVPMSMGVRRLMRMFMRVRVGAIHIHRHHVELSMAHPTLSHQGI